MATRERIRVERKQPVPVGRYWIDIIGQENIDAWGEWLRLNRGQVRQLNVEEDRNADPPTLWALFEVPATHLPGLPIFDQKRFGFPNTAPAGVNAKQDTEQVPDDDPDEPTDLGKAVKVLALVGFALAATVGVFLVASWVEGKRKQLSDGGGARAREREREREREAA